MLSNPGDADVLEWCERRPAVPTAQVEALLREHGLPCLPLWLEFHDRDARYVEQIYSDVGAL